MDQDTLQQLKDTVRRYVRERLVPVEDDVAANDRIPDAIRREMAEMGLFGMSIPEEYGGLGLGMLEECELVMELCWASPVFRSVVGTNNGIGSQGILMDGTEAQKRHWLPRIASGELVASFALTEPEAGSDAASIKTRAVRKGDRYIVNGTKRYITNSPQAGIFTLMARTDPNIPGAGGITAFVVDAKSKGITIGKPDRKMGQRGAHTADVIFEDAEVPAANVIGLKEGQGFKTAMKVLDRGRLHLAAVCCGTAERIIDIALRYAGERKQFGQRIGEFQLVQAMLADCRTEAYAAQSMMRDAASRFDRGENVAMLAACCKYFASEMVGRIADRGVQIHGGAGYMAEYPIERFYRDVRLFRIYEGTSQIQQLVIARAMLRELEAAG
ncbi:MAG TPA: acyl-CoA dehydrogenase family protein [Candidatus Cybelea sp.]|nr:acyl-CoA dehydrogenase family protein [Candidatus Cybelea sp.]